MRPCAWPPAGCSPGSASRASTRRPGPRPGGGPRASSGCARDPSPPRASPRPPRRPPPSARDRRAREGASGRAPRPEPWTSAPLARSGRAPPRQTRARRPRRRATPRPFGASLPTGARSAAADAHRRRGPRARARVSRGTPRTRPRTSPPRPSSTPNASFPSLRLDLVAAPRGIGPDASENVRYPTPRASATRAFRAARFLYFSRPKRYLPSRQPHRISSMDTHATRDLPRRCFWTR